MVVLESPNCFDLIWPEINGTELPSVPAHVQGFQKAILWYIKGKLHGVIRGKYSPRGI